MSIHRLKPTDSQLKKQQKDVNLDWQNFDQKFGNFDKFESMTKLGKKLKKFAEMVHGTKCGIPDLRRELHKIQNVKPESVQSIIDLTVTDQILIAERILTDAHRNTILIDILNTRKRLAEEIVAESEKCTLVTGYAQVVNLYRAWSVIRGAKLTKPNARQHVDQIETTLREATEICFQTKLLMSQFTLSNDLRAKEAIMTQLELNTKQIYEVYERCFEMIQQVDLQIGHQILKLQYIKFEQDEAVQLNKNRAIDKLKPETLFDSILLVEPLFYGAIAGANCLVKNSIKTTKQKLVEINNKLFYLKQLANEIKFAREEAQEFIKFNR